MIKVASSPTAKESMATVFHGRFGAQCSELLSFSASHCTGRGHLLLFVSPCRKRASENQHKNTDTLGTAVALSNKQALVSDPGTSCLLPASMGKLISLYIE